MKKAIMVAIPALLAGIALGVAGSKMFYSDKETAPADQNGADKVKIVKKGLDDNSDVTALRARIRELERRRTDAGHRRHEIASDENAPGSERNVRNLNWRERLEKMKTENPEQYAQHTNRMARWRDMRRRNAVSKLEFLSSIDTTAMSAEEKKTHVRLQNLIEEREELQVRMEDGFASGEMSDETRRAIFDEMRNTDRQIAELNAAERENLIKKTAEAIGLTGEDVGEVAGTIMKVIEATENNPWGRAGRGERRGRGGRR